MADEEPQGLADAAAAALDDTDGEGTQSQDHLPGIDTAKVKFVGMAWEAVESPGLKEECVFTVRATCVGDGQEVMANGDVRTVTKMKVTSVTRQDV